MANIYTVMYELKIASVSEMSQRMSFDDFVHWLDYIEFKNKKEKEATEEAKKNAKK